MSTRCVRGLLQRRQHVGERRVRLVRIPRTIRRLILTTPHLREPQHDQAVEQHRHRRGAFGSPPTPALGLLEAQVLLGVVERDLDRPAHRIPPQHLLGRSLRGCNIVRNEGTSVMVSFLARCGCPFHFTHRQGGSPFTNPRQTAQKWRKSNLGMLRIIPSTTAIWRSGPGYGSSSGEVRGRMRALCGEDGVHSCSGRPRRAIPSPG